MNAILSLVGRILLVLFFAITALNHALDLTEAQAYLASRGIPMPGVFVVIAILLRLVGVVCIGLGYKTRLGVLSLLLFLVFSSAIYYFPFTGYVPVAPLLRNLGLAGGLLLLAVSGPGSIALQGK